jgi:hypothetical protein
MPSRYHPFGDQKPWREVMMGVLSSIKWKWDKVKALTAVLEKWRPRNCKTEKDFENSLYLLLHRELENHQITKQPAQGRFKADLLIDDSLILELKHNLNTTAKYQRLQGQLSEYKKWEGQVVLLLIGETDPNLKKQLLSFLKDQGLRDTFDLADPFNILPGTGDKVIIVEK